MQLYRTEYEAIVEAPIEELREICHELSNIQHGETRVYHASKPAIPVEGLEHGFKLVITADEGPFFAIWKSGVGLISRGNVPSLQAFSSAFDFQCDPVPGLHSHWDFGAYSEVVHDESLPIIVQIGQ